MKLAIISDTHMPRGRRRLPVEHLRDAGAILHAGDLSTVRVLEELAAIGPPVIAVHGNVDEPDVRSQLPARRVFDADGTRIGMVHDAGPASGRVRRMRAAFPDCAAVVFGHSHIPLHEEHEGFHIFNPGSPTDRRRQPRHTMGIATAEDGRLRFELLALD